MDTTENSQQNMSDAEGIYHTLSYSCVLKHKYKHKLTHKLIH